MFTKGDFHLHTTASDGKLPAEKVLENASRKGIDILSITDHDTTDGVVDAIDASKKFDIKVIPGLELSTIHNKESIHILAYFKDEKYNHSEFQSFLKEMTDYRVIRAEKIVHNLKKYFELELDFEKILLESKGVVARPHIARAILDAGYDYSWEYIFDNFLDKNSPAFVPNKKVTTPEGISLLKKFNALVVLAHPMLIKKSKVEDLLKFDFDGIEAMYPLNSENETKELINLAKTHNKIITAGSDYHGDCDVDTKHCDIGSSCLTCENLQVFLDHLSL